MKEDGQDSKKPSGSALGMFEHCDVLTKVRKVLRTPGLTEL